MAVAKSNEVGVAVPGLNALLRDLNKLPKEYRDEMRQQSRAIARRHMVPAFRLAAINHVQEGWRGILADSVREISDRIPGVAIGYQGAAWRLSGGYKGKKRGATPTMLRYPTHRGDRGNSFAPFTRTNWLAEALPAYAPRAMQDWSDAIGRVCADFNDGKVYG